MKLLRKDNKGFTLTELIIVIVIIGILAAVLIPSLTGYVQKARVSAAEQEATSVYSIYKTYKTEIDAGTFTENDKTFPVYYQEITGTAILLQNDGLNENGTGWKVEDSLQTTTIGEDNTSISYLFSYIHENGYIVYLDSTGKIVGSEKR